MTTTFDKAIAEAKKTLTPDRQDQVGKILLEYVALEAAQPEANELTIDDHAAIDEGVRAAEAGEFATPEEVTALFRLYA